MKVVRLQGRQRKYEEDMQRLKALEEQRKRERAEKLERDLKFRMEHSFQGVDEMDSLQLPNGMSRKASVDLVRTSAS